MDVKKLTEEELTEVSTAPAPAVPASEAPATEEPTAPAQPVDVVATPQVAAGESPDADPLTPPAEGMVPTGWAYPEDLAAAIAMATGDVEAAETAADATTTEEPLVTETPAEGTEPVSVTPEAPAPAEEAQPITESLEKVEEGNELPELAEDPLTDLECEECSEEGDIIEDATADEKLAVEEILASFESIFDDDDFTDEVEDSLEDAEEVAEDVEEDTEEEVTPGEIADTLDDLSDILRAFDTDEIEDDAEVDITETDVDEAFDFLAALEDDLFDDEEDVEEDVEEVDEEAPVDVVNDEAFADANPEEAFEESTSSITGSKIKEASGIKYPAGSAPKESAIVSGVPAEESIEPVEPVAEDLVRSYEEKSRARRQALADFREGIIQKRKENSRFGEALNSGSTSKTSTNKDAWSNNTFIEKYNESRKLNWKELFEKGLLG